LQDEVKAKEPIQDMTRRARACGFTQKPWTFCSIAQHRQRRRGRCSKVTQDAAELLTLPIRLDWDAANLYYAPL
jgi:hypothetical protein